MRRKNWRLVIVGFVLVLAAPAFFLFFLSIASKSNDPAALMQTVGQVAGVVGAIGLVMLVIGLIGRK
jgi:nitrate reductase gamma subunit